MIVFLNIKNDRKTILGMWNYFKVHVCMSIKVHLTLTSFHGPMITFVFLVSSYCSLKPSSYRASIFGIGNETKMFVWQGFRT